MFAAAAAPPSKVLLRIDSAVESTGFEKWSHLLLKPVCIVFCFVGLDDAIRQLTIRMVCLNVDIIELGRKPSRP